MRLVLLIAILFTSGCMYSQDTLLHQEFENIEIHSNQQKEIAFADSKHYILDFYIGERGNFVLLKKRSNYFLCSLSNDLELEDSLQLNFKPEKLLYDCLGFFHVLGRDSMCQIEKINDELVIYETNSIRLYHDFLEGCVASNGSQLIFKQLEDFNQTTVYYGMNTENQKRTNLYRFEDPIRIRSAKETHDSLVFYNPGETAMMGEFGGYDLDATGYYDFVHQEKQKQDFFDQIVKIPDYLPVFVNQDTTFIFDYLSNVVVAMNDTGRVYRAQTIPFNESLKIEFDAKQGRFYSVTRESGAQSYDLLSNENFETIRRTKITDHAHPRKVVIYNGYLYYLEKQFVGDNLNKLFRQRMF